jgi:hypothetical protein
MRLFVKDQGFLCAKDFEIQGIGNRGKLDIYETDTIDSREI